VRNPGFDKLSPSAFPGKPSLSHYTSPDSRRTWKRHGAKVAIELDASRGIHEQPRHSYEVL
jgi:hypothetical protein